MPPPVFDVISTISFAQDALTIVTVTPTAGTTTVFITSSLPSSSSSSKGGSTASRQKAVIAGSAVGGFLGFSLILALLLWFFYFRKSNRQGHNGLDGTRGVIFGGRRSGGDDEKRGPSSSISNTPAPASELRNDGGEKMPDGSEASPVQPNPSISAVNQSLVDSRPRPTPKRTITSVSDSDGRRRIPVVVPSFVRDSQGSGSSGAASRFANALKRGSGAGATVSSSSSGARSSAAPYQYGMVGSAESRRGSMLATEFPSTPLGPTESSVHFYDEHGRLAPGHSPEENSLSLPPSSYGNPGPRPPLAHSHHVANLSASTAAGSAAGGMPISGSGSGSGHSADSNHPLIIAATVNAAASSSSHNSHSHSHDHDRPVPSTSRDHRSRHPSDSSNTASRVQKNLPARPVSSASVDEHIALSNYILPPSALSSSSLPGGSGKRRKGSRSRESSRHEKAGRERGATVSDSGHGNDGGATAIAEPQPIASGSGSMFANFQRSLSLDLASGNKLKRPNRSQAPSPSQAGERERRPSAPSSAGPNTSSGPMQLGPARQSSPPPSSYYRHLPFTAASPSQPFSRSTPPSPTAGYVSAPVTAHVSDRDTSDENEVSSSTSAEADRQRRRRTRRRTGSGSGTESADQGYAHYPSPVQGRSRGGSAPPPRPLRPSTGTAGTSDDSAMGGIGGSTASLLGDEELARLARAARRAERRIRRASRAEAASDPGHGYSREDRGHGPDRQRRSSRHRSSSRTRRDRSGSAGSHTGQGAERPPSSSSRTRPQLVLRNV